MKFETETTRWRECAWLAALGALLWSGCAAPQPLPPFMPPPAAAPDLGTMFVDAAASGLLCDRLRDQFVGLPGDSAAPGPYGALAPKEGRLWVQSCQVRALGSQLLVQIAGPGWRWVNREEDGFRVRQHVYFHASMDMMGALQVAYDPTTKVASVYVQPVAVNRVSVEPVGSVVAHPETLAALFIDVATLGILSTQEARAAVAEKGAERFADALLRGGTVTYDIERRQFDFVLGYLPGGLPPPRPFTATSTWWANERMRLHPGAVHVLGPFEQAGAMITAVPERGVGAVVRGVCKRDLLQAAGSVVGGGAVQLRTEAVFLTLPLNAKVTQAVAATCPWYLLVTPPADSAADVAILVAPAQGWTPQFAPHSAVIRLTLVSYRINQRTPSGGTWDDATEAPDPRIRVRGAGVNELLVAEEDQYDGTPVHTVQRPVEVSSQSPLKIIVVDADAVFDDDVGEAIIPAHLAARGGEFDVAVIDKKKRPTGSVRVRVEVLKTE